MFREEFILLIVDDVDDGPGLGCKSPEHKSIIASHV